MQDRASLVTRRSFMAGASFLLASTCMGCTALPRRKAKRIAFLAGNPSHGYGEHAHPAGCRLLADRLNKSPDVIAEVAVGHWPEDDAFFDGLDALVIYGDGDRNHPMRDHEEIIRQLADRGVGLGFMHYALIPPAKESHELMLDAIGGYYETWWSVNPIWEAGFGRLPVHPILNGVEPFTIRDEWYYHMRFAPDLKGVEPLLAALPPEQSLERADGPHSNNPHVRKSVLERKENQIVAWAFERPNGGRGFGMTGGHFHWNWAHDGYRTLLLNAILWLAKIDVPEKGFESNTPTLEELKSGLGEPPDNFRFEGIQGMMDEWN